MRVILDENVPIQAGQFLKGHDVTTVQREGWAGIENGDLLNLVDGAFDVMVLADKNLRYQQNLAARRIAFVELSCAGGSDQVFRLRPDIAQYTLC